jgi:phage tail-like protein
MPTGEELTFGLAMRFQVTLGGDINLGYWQACDGLSVDFDPVPREEGGNNDYAYYLPGQVKYTEVTLKRAVTKQHSPTVLTWLKSMVDADEGQTMTIDLLGADGTSVMKWSLRNVLPKKWTGPSLNAGTSAIAIETLSVVHEGFLED